MLAACVTAVLGSVGCTSAVPVDEVSSTESALQAPALPDDIAGPLGRPRWRLPRRPVSDWKRFLEDGTETESDCYQIAILILNPGTGEKEPIFVTVCHP